MKYYILAFFSLTLILFSCSAIERKIASASLDDVPYHFGDTKVEKAEDALHFTRAFTDYFYLLIKNNRSKLKTVSSLDQTVAWCLGDPHPENFGSLILNDGNAIFSMNDLDDSAPCPAIDDFLRFLVTAKMTVETVPLSSLISLYIDGVSGKSHPVPGVVQEMLKKAGKQGVVIGAKQHEGEKLIRKKNGSEFTASELKELRAVFPNYKIIDAYSRSKKGGGSAGVLRYEMLANFDGVLVHLELKEQTQPAVYPVSPNENLDFKTRLTMALRYTQGDSYLKYYQALKFKDKNMWLRAKCAGNDGVDFAMNSDFNNLQFLTYEAYLIGRLHASSIKDSSSWVKLLTSFPSSQIESDVQLLKEKLEKVYASLN